MAGRGEIPTVRPSYTGNVPEIDVGARQAPERAASQLVGVLNEGVKDALSLFKDAADKAKETRKLAVDANVDKIVADYRINKVQQMNRMENVGDADGIRSLFGENVEPEIETLVQGFTDENEQEYARAKLFQAAAAIHIQSVERADAIHTRMFVQGIDNDIETYSVQAAAQVPIKDLMAQLQPKLDIARDSGFAAPEQVEQIRLEAQKQFSMSAVNGLIAQAEKDYSRLGPAAAEKTLRNKSAKVIAETDQTRVGPFLSKRVEDAIQQFSIRADSLARSAQVKEFNAKKRDFDSYVKGLDTAIALGDPVRFNDRVKDIEAMSSSDIPDIRQLTENFRRDVLPKKSQQMGELAHFAEVGKQAVTAQRVIPYGDPRMAKVWNARTEQTLDGLADQPTGVRLGMVNALAANSAGAWTPRMKAEWSAAFDEAGTATGAETLSDSYREMQEISPAAFGEFIKTAEGKSVSKFVAEYNRQKSSVLISGINPDQRSAALGVAANEAMKLAMGGVDDAVFTARNDRLETRRGKDALAAVVNSDLKGLLGKNLGNEGLADALMPRLNKGVNAIVYSNIVQKTKDYYVNITAGGEKDMNKALAEALKLAVPDVLRDYQFTPSGFQRDTPFRYATSPVKADVMRQEISEKIYLGEFAADRNQAKMAADNGKYLGNPTDGWIIYAGNQVVSKQDGEVFIYKPGEQNGIGSNRQYKTGETPNDPNNATDGELGIIPTTDTARAGTKMSALRVSVDVDGKSYIIPTLVKGQIHVDDLAAGKPPTKQQIDIAIKRYFERVKNGASQGPNPFNSYQEADAWAAKDSKNRGNAK